MSDAMPDAMPNGTGPSAAALPPQAMPAPPGAAAPIATTGVFLATFGLVLGLIVAFLGFDLFLARIDRNESAAHAGAEYRAGTALLAAGRAREAAERFGAAVAIDRRDLRYALALAQARLAAGDVPEAEAALADLLDRAENDGAVNLVMARTMLREGRVDEAKSYYHRAIFGRWGADSTRRRADARWELIDLLAERGATRELLAELLPLQDTPPDSVALRRRLGQLFVRAGSPARGAAMLRDVLRRDPDDGEAYAGMGEAALALGNFRTARADFAEAARLRPDDVRVAGRLALADTVLVLDPAARGIGAHARYTRSRELLARTIAARERCASRGAPSANAVALLDSARATLLVPVPPRDEDSAGEGMLSLASELWSARPTGCAGDAMSDEALAIVHERISR